MGRNRRGLRDGSGPRNGSWQRRNVGVGKRRQAGQKCPVSKKSS